MNFHEELLFGSLELQPEKLGLVVKWTVRLPAM